MLFYLPSMYRFAIIGLGKIARKFAADLKLVEGATLTSVASRSQERADAFGNEFHARYATGSYPELFEGPYLDAVYIATPHTSHAELTRMCLERDLAVICEKPLGLNHREVAEVVELARHRGVYLLEALWTRFLPTFQAAKKRLLEDGAIGDLQGLRADFGFKIGPATGKRVYDPALGGGALLDIGIYPVFLAQVLFGAPQDIEASARLSDGIDVDTNVVLTYAGGQRATLHCTLLARTKTEAVVYGSEGTLFWDGLWYQQSSFTIKRDDSDDEVRYATKERGFGYAFEAQAMVEDLRANRKESPLWTLDDSLLLHRTLSKIREVIGLRYAGEGELFA